MSKLENESRELFSRLSNNSLGRKLLSSDIIKPGQKAIYEKPEKIKTIVLSYGGSLVQTYIFPDNFPDKLIVPKYQIGNAPCLESNYLHVDRVLSKAADSISNIETENVLAAIAQSIKEPYVDNDGFISKEDLGLQYAIIDNSFTRKNMIDIMNVIFKQGHVVKNIIMGNNVYCDILNWYNSSNLNINMTQYNGGFCIGKFLDTDVYVSKYFPENGICALADPELVGKIPIFDTYVAHNFNTTTLKNEYALVEEIGIAVLNMDLVSGAKKR